MNLDALSSFIAVVREKSITKAANSLYITQPTLSIRIRKLEELLGVNLLERSSGGVQLTRHGYEFIPYAIHMAQYLTFSTKIIGHEKFDKVNENGNLLDQLTIGLDPSLVGAFLKPISNTLQQHYPLVNCKFFSRHSNLLVDLLKSGWVHFAIFYGKEPPNHLESEHLFEDELVLLCSENNYPHLKDDLSNIDILSSEPFFFLEMPLFQHFNTIIKQNLTTLFGALPARIHYANDINMILQLVLSGIGYSLVPKTSVISSIAAACSLRAIPLDSTFPKISLFMASSMIHSPSSSHPMFHTLFSTCRNLVITEHVNYSKLLEA